MVRRGMPVISRVGFAAILGLVLLFCGTAVAEEVDEISEELSTMEEALTGLEDEALEFAPDEFERARAWLDEAQHIHQEGGSSGLEQRMRRVDHSIDLLRALVTTEELKASIEGQRQAHESSKQQVEALREEIENLEAQKAERQRELDDIRSELDD